MPLKSTENLNKLTLTDSKVAAEYLSAVYEECAMDSNFDAFLIAIRNIIQANASMAEVAESAGVGRQALYHMLSENGNPQLYNISSVLKTMGLKIKFEAEKRGCLKILSFYTIKLS